MERLSLIPSTERGMGIRLDQFVFEKTSARLAEERVLRLVDANEESCT